MFETIAGALKRPTEKKAGEVKCVVTRTAGPASYASGGFDATVSELSEVISAIVVAEKGYGAEIDWGNSSGNKLRIVAYSSADTEVTAGTDLSGVYFTIIALGW